MSLNVPVALSAGHDCSVFSCGESELDNWLRQKALKNHEEGASRCFVVCEASRVVGYYALAAGAVMRADAVGNIRGNMPEPIPVVVLGRLAVDATMKGKGVGAGLLKDAIQRGIRLFEELGVRAMLCHAISDDARSFYLKFGFAESPNKPMALMLSLKNLSMS